MTEGLKIAKELSQFGVEAIAVEVYDILNTKHHNNIKLTQKEIFLCGLAYSEFYCENDSNYLVASDKQKAYLKALNLESNAVYNLVESYYQNTRIN